MWREGGVTFDIFRAPHPPQVGPISFSVAQIIYKPLGPVVQRAIKLILDER